MKKSSNKDLSLKSVNGTVNKTDLNLQQNNFWNKIHKPFFVLAPMANVTDSVFRSIITKYGKPDVIWTEFVSADGLISPGRKNLLHDLVYSEIERPIVAQLFTGNPESMRKAAQLSGELGFDGLDINMGCPDRAVEKQGGGANMIKNPKTAIEVINSARSGYITGVNVRINKTKKKNNKKTGSDSLDNTNSIIPISVKTRLGYNTVDFIWLETLLQQKLPALTIHLRTRKEMSDVPARWELMPEIVKLRDKISPQTLIIGNGDVYTLIDAKDKVEKYGCDGVMIGRGIFGKPWFFENIDKIRNEDSSIKQTNSDEIIIEKNPEQRLKIMVEHAKLFEKTFQGIKNFAVMKKHFKAYVSGWDGAKELRVKLMETESAKDVSLIVKQYLGDLNKFK